MDRDKVCCFTGHRPEKIGFSKNEISKRLEAYIDEAISDGYDTFISGMARGTDMWAADIVLKKKHENKKIKLICAVPYNGFERRWAYSDKMQYRFILDNADSVSYISPRYTPYCFQARNIWMVDKSSRIIAVFNGSSGGTMNTIKYAVRNDVAIKNILISPFSTRFPLD